MIWTGNPANSRAQVLLRKLTTVVLLSLGVLAEGAESQVYSWSRATSSAAWSGRYGSRTAAFNGALYLFGGSPDSRTHLNDVWRTTDGVNWTRLYESAPWPARVSIRVVGCGGRLWVIGEGPNDVWTSQDGVVWTQVAEEASWGPRSLYGVVALQDKVWILGGKTVPTETPLYDVWSSSDGADWTKDLDQAPWAVPVWPTRFANDLWIFGAERVYPYTGTWHSPDGIVWTRADTQTSKQSPVPFDGCLWGLDEGYFNVYAYNFEHQVWRSPDALSWERLPDAPWSRRIAQSVVAFDGKLWMMGGLTYDNECLNDVWCMSVVPVTVEGDARPWHQVGEGLTLTVSSPETPSKLSAGVGYQWLLNGVALAGATEDTYHVDALEESDSGAYTCVLTGEVFGTAGPFQVNVVEGPIPVAGLVGLIASACGIILSAIVLRRRMARQ